MASRRKSIVVSIAVVVGLLHFLIGPAYAGPLKYFVNGYLLDILVPFSMYLVAGFVNHPVMGAPLVRAMAVAGVGFFAETLQYFNLAIFGRTFDLMDYPMYIIGVGLGFILEVTVLNRLKEVHKH